MAVSATVLCHWQCQYHCDKLILSCNCYDWEYTMLSAYPNMVKLLNCQSRCQSRVHEGHSPVLPSWTLSKCTYLLATKSAQNFLTVLLFFPFYFPLSASVHLTYNFSICFPPLWFGMRIISFTGYFSTGKWHLISRNSVKFLTCPSLKMTTSKVNNSPLHKVIANMTVLLTSNWWYSFCWNTRDMLF